MSFHKMWLGSRVCVQWGAKLMIFQSKSVSIAYLGTLLSYINDNSTILTIFQWLDEEKYENWPQIGRIWTENLVPSHKCQIYQDSV